MTGILVHLLAFLVLGAHMVVPWRLAARQPTDRRGWALLCLPTLLLVLLAGGWFLASHPDALLAAGWGSRPTSDLIVRSLGVTVPVLILVDLVLLAGWRKLEDMGWRLAAGFAFVATLTAGAFLELLRTGEGPWSPPMALGIAAGCHALVALAAGEAMASSIARRALYRPYFALLAALSIPTYFIFLPSAVREELWSQGWGITAIACALLFAVVRWLPARLRRLAVFAAIVLWSLFLGMAGEISSQIPDARTAPVILPGV